MITESPAHRHALTLFEVIISITIIGVLLTAMLTFLWQFMQARDHAALASEQMLLARQVLERLATELRACVGSDQIGFPMEQGQRLLGDRRSITFLTTALPEEHQYRFTGQFDDLPPAQHDLRQIGYWLWVDPENTTEDGEPIVGGIIRTEKKTLNQFLVDEEDPLDLRNDLWSHELGFLEFRYFDGVEWTTEWNVTEGNSLPQLVQITVGYKPVTKREYENDDLSEYPVSEYPLGDDRPHADRYSTIVKLPAADKLFGSRVQRIGQQFSDQLGVGGLEP